MIPSLIVLRSTGTELWSIPERIAEELLGALGDVSVLGAELFHTAGFDDAGLSAGVEGVAFRAGIKLEERVGHAVDFNGFLGLHSRGDDEGLVDREVNEGDGTILGVNIGFNLNKFRK